MKKRILSLFLAVVMVLLAVPTLAIATLAAEAETGSSVVYSTSFSNDPTSENFPSIDLPAATDESTYKWNGLDFSGLEIYDYLKGGVTYKGNWEIGTIGVNWDATGTAAPTVNAESFYPYTDFYRASATEICITTGNAIWGTGNAVQSGGLWLNSARNSMIAGIVYNTTSPANNRLVTNYVGTAAVRYTTEYAGTIDISAVAGVAYRNGVSLVILHNGTVVHTVNNTDMTTNDGGTDLGTVKSGLAVEKGDTIDFVCLGDVNYDYDSYAAAGYEAFDYQKSKRGIREFEFTLGYTSVGLPYSTTMTPGGENWPTIDGYTPSDSGYNAADFVDGAYYNVTYPGAWDIGNRPHTGTDKDGFERFTNVNRSGGSMILTSTRSNAYWSYNGGIYFGEFNNALMFSGMNYTTTTNTRDTVTPDKDPSIRYTAEYTGDVVISIDLLYFRADDTTYFKVLHNGAEVASVLAGNGQLTFPAEDAEDRTKMVSGTVLNMGSAFGDNGKISLSVQAGDTIEFVSSGNENFRNDVALGEDSKYGYLDWATANSTYNAYNNAKRGAYRYSFTVTYEAGYTVEPIVDVWDGENSATPYNYTTDTGNSILYFFAWYKAATTEGEEPTRLSSGYTAFDETCYAVPNPDLIAAGVFSEEDTYEEAMAKYCAYIKSLSYITYENNWQMGENRGGKFDAILYPSFFDQKAPYMVRTPSAGGYYLDPFAKSRWVSEDTFDEMFKGFYEATWTWYSGTTRPNTTIPTKDTKIADVKVTFSDDISIATAPTYNDDGSQKTPGNGAGVNAAQGYGQAKAPTTAGAAVGGLEGNCFTNAANTFWVRAASSSTSSVQGGSFAYTAPRAGTLKLTADYVDFWGNAYAHGQVAGQSAQWALFVNGVRMTDFAVVDNGEMGDNYKTDAAASINTALATAGLDTMTVNEGDLVEIVVIRPTSNTGYHVKMGLTATLTPEIGVAANLVIDDSYAMNLFVQPVDPKAAEAGVIVKNDDGTTTKLAGAKQADGTFMVTVADEIPVYELAGMTDDTGSEPDYAGVTVNYVPYEIGGSYTEGADMSSNTLSLLNAYMASENEKVATLAEAVRALAVASRNAIKKTGGVGNGVKAFLKGSYTISDNYLSGANDMELAALKKLTVPGYTFTWGTASFDDATINIDTTGYEAVKYGWAEGVVPTDAASYAYTVAAANVDLGDKISMIFLVAANGENDIYALKNGYRLKISGADQDYYGDFYSYELNGKTYMAVTVDVPVKYYATDLTVTVVNAEGTAVSADMTYSVKAWCVRNYEFGAKGSNAIQYTLKAVYLLGKAAAAYAAN